MDIAGGSTDGLARTGILIENVGLDAARAELLGLADTADAVGKRAGQSASEGANVFAQSYVEAARQARAALTTELATSTAGIREALARDFITQDQARSAGHDAAVAYKQGLLAAIDQGEKIGAFNGPTGEAAYRQLADALKVATDAETKFAAEARAVLGAEQAAYAQEERRQSSLRGLVAAEQAAYQEEERRSASVRKMALLQAEAIAIDEARARALSANSAATAIANNAITGLGNTAGRSGASLNTLRGSITAMLASSLQTAPGVAQLGSAVGALALGTGATVAVLGGLAAISAAYHALTDDARKAKEEQDKLTDSLHRWYVEQQAGPPGQLTAQIDAGIAKVRELRHELETPPTLTSGNAPYSVQLRAQIEGLLSAGGPLGQLVGTANSSAIRDWFLAREKDVEQGSKEVEAAIKAANERIAHALQDQAREEISGLSSAISSNRATGDQDRLASFLVEDLQRQLAQAQRTAPPASSGDAFRTNLQEQIRLTQQLTELQGAFRSRALAALHDIEQEQAAASASMNAYIAANKSALDSIERGGDQLRTGATRNADDLRASEQAAQLARAEGAAREYLTNQFKAENAAIEANRSLTGIALRERLDTIKAIRDQADALTRLHEAQAAVTAIGARNEAATKGDFDNIDNRIAALKDFQNGFQRDLARAIAGGLKDGFASLGNLLKDAENAAADLAARTLASKAKGALFGKDGAGGFFSVTDQETLGQFAIAGAAVVGFANALNNLTGAVNKTAQELDNEIRSRISARISLETYQRSQLGSPIEQQLASSKDAADQQRTQIESAFSGSRFEGERNRLLSQVAATEAAKNAQIAKDFFDGITRDLNATQGAAGAYRNALAAIDSSYAQNLAGVDALAKALGYSADQTKAAEDEVRALADAQRAAAKAAYDESQRQLQFSLDAREAYAKGETAIGDLLTRRAQEDAERFKAEQEGWSDADKARLAYIQSLEDEKAALNALRAASQTLAQSTAAGPTGTLSSQQAANLQPLLDRQTDDQRAYDATHDALVRQLADDTKRLTNDLAAHADETTILADRARITADNLTLQTQETTRLGDAAAIAAQQFQDSIAKINDAIASIQQDVSLGFITDKQGLDAEAQAFGFGGLSIDDIRKLYTPFSPDHELTNQERETNREIAQYLRDFDRVNGTLNGLPKAVSDAISNTAPVRDVQASDAVSYAARNTTEITSNRMADYLASMLTIEREQLQLWQRYLGGGAAFAPSPATSPGAIPFFAQPIGYSENRGAQPSSVAGIDVNALAAVLGSQRGPTPANSGGTRDVNLHLTIDVRATRAGVRATASDDEIDSLVDRIKGRLIDAIAKDAALQRLADGSPLVSG